MNDAPGSQTPFYLRMLGVACALIAVLGFCVVFIVGYRPPSLGRVATIVLLAAGAVALFVGAHRLDLKRKQ